MLAAPVILPGAFIGAAQLVALRFRYSVFGSQPRRSFPDEAAFEKTAGSGSLGWWRASWPFVTWTVFPSGLGLWMLPVGRVFLPWSEVRRAKRGLLRVRLEHQSPEVRGKITLPERLFGSIRPHLERAGAAIEG